jgi:hypothetical protein
VFELSDGKKKLELNKLEREIDNKGLIWDKIRIDAQKREMECNRSVESVIMANKQPLVQYLYQDLLRLNSIPLLQKWATSDLPFKLNLYIKDKVQPTMESALMAQINQDIFDINGQMNELFNQTIKTGNNFNVAGKEIGLEVKAASIDDPTKIDKYWSMRINQFLPQVGLNNINKVKAPKKISVKYLKSTLPQIIAQFASGLIVDQGFKALHNRIETSNQKKLLMDQLGLIVEDALYQVYDQIKGDIHSIYGSFVESIVSSQDNWMEKRKSELNIQAEESHRKVSDFEGLVSKVDHMKKGIGDL